jgi:hypothetical protein
MTNITPHTLRGAAYAHLGIPRYVGHSIIHYFHRRTAPKPQKPPATLVQVAPCVFKRKALAKPLAAPTDKRRRAPRAGSLATIGEIVASKL